MYDAAPMDPATLRLTAGVVALIVVLAVGLFVTSFVRTERRFPPWARWLLRLVSSMQLVIPLWAMADAPRRYVLEGDALVVERLRGEVRLPLAGLHDVRIEEAPLAGAVRRAGNGGLFGWWGRFWSPRGDLEVFATSTGPAVVFVTRTGTKVVTPKDPAALAVALSDHFAGSAQQRNPSW